MKARQLCCKYRRGKVRCKNDSLYDRRNVHLFIRGTSTEHNEEGNGRPYLLLSRVKMKWRIKCFYAERVNEPVIHSADSSNLWSRFWVILRPCQHDNGYRWSVTDLRPHRRTDPGSHHPIFPSIVTYPCTNRGRRALTSVNVPLSWPWSSPQALEAEI